jgi:ATP-binding cassette subfamily B (MDR/TAP) protein 1
VTCTSTSAQLVQDLTTSLGCLILAFYFSYKLTFVILATVPIIVVLSVITERLAAPILAKEREILSQASSRVDRVVSSISTVKAFNAQIYEHDAFCSIVQRHQGTYQRIVLVWGVRVGIVSFLLLAMFVQAFWFGSFLVSRGDITVGAVTQVFWATLEAAGHFQGCIPLLALLEKGKIGMATMLTLARSKDQPSSAEPLSPSYSPVDAFHPTFDAKDSSLGRVPPGVAPRKPRLGPLRSLRKIHPARFSGEMNIRHVTFHYPSRPHPHPPVLRDVSLFLPAKETTYIVGESGSGKSTVGALLMGMYRPDSGFVEAGEQGLDWLDEGWLRSEIGMVSQGASIVFEGTVHENVAVGITGRKQGRVEDVTREQVVKACRVALIHDFVRDLLDGYDTWLSGEKGASLSGGQRQRIAIARAFIRDPTVLILGTLPHFRMFF